ncbi:M20 metallopeptidase family protein [Pirellulaceae bacterium SH449]
MHQFPSGQKTNSEVPQAINAVGASLLPMMRKIRRQMHAHPELSMQELETTRFLQQKLESLGFQPKSTPRAVGLTFDWETGPGADRRIGLRADIDALPIQTVSTTDYASQVSGVMHACGHDAHSAMLIGASCILKSLHEQGLFDEPVAIRGILQPAEETSEGASYMLENGAADDLAAAMALHVDPNLQSGYVASRCGPFTAGCDAIEVTVRGRSGHSARPYQAIDALHAASSWLQQAYARLPRIHDCREPSVFALGTFHAGVASNVVADTAVLTGTLRTVSDSVRLQLLDALNSVSTSIEAGFGCRIDLKVSAFTPSMQNDPRITETAMRAARQLLGDNAVETIPLPSMGAEDFAFFCRKIPCCMFRLGTAGQRHAATSDHSSPLHSPDFDIDEDALVVGAKLLATCAIEFSYNKELFDE